jgi:hypothetical protein
MVGRPDLLAAQIAANPPQVVARTASINKPALGLKRLRWSANALNKKTGEFPLRFL